MGEEVRSWRLHRRTGHTLAELAAVINPIVRGWSSITARSTGRRCMASSRASTPTCCAGSDESTNGCGPSPRPRRAGAGSPPRAPPCSPTGSGAAPPGDQDDKSRMSREAHVRICGGRGLCPEFTLTEGSSAGTQGYSVDLGRVDPWVRAQPGGSCSSAGVWRICRAAAQYRIAVVSSSPNTTARWSGSGPWVSASSS